MTDHVNGDLDTLRRAVLLKRLQQSGGAKSSAPAPVQIPRVDRGQALPLSWPQQRLWFLDRLDPVASTAYHLFSALRITGALDEAALRASLDRLLDRHESLRTTVGTVDGEPVQSIAPAGTPFPLARCDFGALPPDEREAALAALSSRDAEAPFDLARGPLVRGVLARLGAQSHVLLICQHHLVTDGWSMQVFVREFTELYRAFAAGQNDPLPAPVLQFADVAAWQRARLQGAALDAQLAFWRQHLEGAPALLELPADRARPASQSFAGGSVEFRLAPALCRGLRELGQRHGATLFMTLLAGWSVLLARLSGQSEIVVGTPVANRPTREVEGLIGYFANTLALRVRVDEATRVADLITQVKRATLAAFEHQDVPFEQVVEALNPSRSLAYGPVFQNLFTLGTWSATDAITLPGLSIEPIASDRIRAKTDLSLSLSESGEQLIGVLEYASDLFDDSTVRRWASHFETLLGSMVADEQQALGALALLSADEVHQLTHEFNAHNTRLGQSPRDRLVHSLFEEQAAQQPNAVAVVDGDRRLSFAEVNRRANRLAHHLLAQGVQAEDRVAVSADRSAELIVALLAILKAGAAYLPIDPAVPQERQAFMLADAEARLLLTQSHLQAKLPQTVPVALLDDPALTQGLPEHDPAIAMTPDRLAYVIYTSGSTGQAKGVMVTHRNVVHLNVGQPFIDFSPQHCLAYCANPAFDASTWEIWGTLLNGARLVVVPMDVLLEPAQLAALLEREQVTILQLIAGLLKRYAQPMAQAFARLQVLLFGGDQSELATVLGIWRSAPACRLIHAYGPTETTTFTTEYIVGEHTVNERTLPIGRAIADSQLYVLDARGNPVPPGVEGEIYIGGEGVTRGYLKRPELTAERFVDDRFSGRPNARLYRTGDLGRVRLDGNLEFLGRNDSQVKLRGYRVELGEIELGLAQCAGIVQAFVMVRTDAAGEKRLVAYLTSTEPVDAGALRAELGRHLPEYMVPAAFVRMDAIPVTANGKVDRRALPEPDETATAARVYAAPQGEVETALAEIWQQLLQVPRVGRDDHFFELGGHSLMVVTMVERLRQRGWLLEVRQVFDTPALARLAVAVTALHDAAAHTPAPQRAEDEPITPDDLTLVTLTQPQLDTITATLPGGAAAVQDIYPLLPLQEGILYHHLRQQDGDTYLSRTVLGFDDRGHLDAFVSALQAAIERHDALRTGVYWEGLPAPVQVVLRHAELTVDELPADSDGPALDQLLRLTDPRHTRIDLRHAPLLRAHAVTDGRGGWLLALLQHHIVTDHVSLEVVLREIRQQATNGPALPAPVPFRHFVERSLALPAKSHEDYFRALLADIDDSSAPFGLMAKPADARRDEAHLALDAPLAQRVRTAARRLGVPPSVLFHVAWAQVVALCCGRDDIVFGTVLTGRMGGSDGIGDVVGMLINTLPLRVRTGTTSVADCVAQIFTRLSELMAHEHAPLAMVQQCSALPPGVPLFTSLLNYRHGVPTDLADAGPLGLRTVHAEEASTVPITASVNDLQTGFSITLLTGGVSAARMADYLQRAVEGVVAALEAGASVPMHTIAVLPESERQRLLCAFNDSARTFAPEPFVHSLFEAQARRQPDAIAAEFEGKTLSCGELNRRANQLAHRLLALGVRPDDCVAVCVERGLALVVGMLGVLKAGAAYAPLDPSLPTARLAFMLQDSAPTVLLSERALLGQVPVPAGLRTLLLDDPAVFEGQPDTDPDPVALGLRPDHVSYVIYTSGSTGQPKGVLNRHDGLCNVAQSHLDAFELRTGGRILQFATCSFDAGVWEIALALVSGATLVLAPRSALRPGLPLADTLRERAITHVILPSSAVAAMPQDVSFDGLCLVMAGDACPPALAARWARRGPVFNGYGPTETSIVATVHPCSTTLLPAVPLGRPNPNVQLYVLGAHGQVLPLGAIGEIYIGGTGVGRGYLNRPELTAERFVDDPFSGRAGARLYRSGDRGRWSVDGLMDYIGRIDFQVKLRGFRIEPGEIETALMANPGVAEAVVLMREDVPGDRRLVAYLRAADGAQIDPVAERERLASRFADYMVPSAFVVLPTFPLLPNGKLDRHSLPAPDDAAVASRPYEAPRGAAEEAVAAVWCALLGLDRVGRDDQFFAVGGHSLLAVQVIARLHEALGVKIDLNDVFTFPVLAEFAARIPAAAASPLAPLPQADRGAPLPLSWAQERLWFVDQLDRSASAMYHLPSALRLTGTLDRAALQRTLDHVLARHENLRTSFPTVNDRPQMCVHADAHFDLPCHDLSSLDADVQAAEIERLRRLETQTLFDIANGPLVRGRLLRLADDEHLLLITQHHIISDAWSFGVMVREVNALYDAFRAGRADPLPALPIQYADYAAWQRAELSADRLDQQFAWWKAHLDSAPGLLDLPLDRPRPLAQRFEAASLPVSLSPALTAGLRALAARHGCTLFMTVMAGWALLLSRLSSQDSVVIASAITNRDRVELEGLTGLFVNTLCFHVHVDRTASVAGLLAAVRETALGGYAHQDLPFDQLLEKLNPPRSQGHHPLFQTLLSMADTPMASRFALDGLEVEMLQAEVRHTVTDVNLSLQQANGGLVGHFAYATALFDEATIARWRDHLSCVLAGMVEDDTREVQRVRLLPAHRLAEAARGFNAPEQPAPAFLAHAPFEAQAARDAIAVAVAWDEQTIGYGELNRRANALAQRLIALGLDRGDRVAICVGRNVHMVVAVLAVFKAGCTAVPLDPTYPADRLTFMIGDSAAALLLVEAAFEPLCRTDGRRALLLDDDAESGGSDTNPLVPGLTPDDTAYVIYTSGSTGQPKGIRVPHRAVASTVAGLIEIYQVDAASRVLQFLSFGFDVCLSEILMALSTGARLCMLRPHELLGAPLADAIRAHATTHACLPGGVLASFPADTDLGALRSLMTGGEALPPSLAAFWGARYPLYNSYGPSETAITATVHLCDPRATGPVPIGRPLPHVQVYILDDRQEPVAPGVFGEVVIGGAGVADGYLGRPELDAERFLPDPFSVLPGARMYRSGDIGRWSSHGTIEFRGREDTQVKIRGFRIELGEIEAALLACEGVADAVVIAKDGPGGDRRLVAFFCAAAGQVPDTVTIRQTLSAALPRYMVPSALVSLDAFRLTSQGKIDRRWLQGLDVDALVARQVAAPEGATEQALAQHWQALLGVSQIGRDDDFFELGGHSLLAVQLVARLRQAMGVEIPLAELFANPVLSAFARCVDVAARVGSLGITPVPRDVALPLSWAQQRLWFLDRLDAATGAAYHMSVGLRLTGRLNEPALREALDRIVARHEALRTTFDLVDGEPRQRIAEADTGFTLQAHDLRELHGHEQEFAVERHSLDQAEAPFDLERGPLAGGLLLRLADEQHVLLVKVHHIVSDGWSIGLFVRELSALYAAFSRHQADPLPPLPIQYADYAAWQRGWLQGERLQAQVDFWTTHLRGAPALVELPTDRPRPARQNHRGAGHGFALPETLVEGLRGLSQRHGATLFMTLLAGWSLLLARMSGQRDVVVGTSVANRPHAELEPLIGFFVNTLALRVQVDETTSVADLIAQVRATTLAAYAHQDLPFEQVVEALQPPRTLAHSPLFQTMLALNNTPAGALTLPGLTLAPVTTPHHTTQFDLTIALVESPDGLRGEIVYATDLFDESTVQRLVGSLEKLLAGMVADEQASVLRLPIVAAEELALQWDTWNRSERSFPLDRGFIALFEEQARLHPDRLAATDARERLSYRELDDRANRLALALVAQGAGRETLVTLMCERNVMFLAMMLATFKAGAAFLPLDIKHPPARLMEIVRSSGSPLVLASERCAAQVQAVAGELAVKTVVADAHWRTGEATYVHGGGQPDDLAYVIFTSGSTGKPKGAMVEQRGMLNHLFGKITSLNVSADEVLAQTAAPSFDICVWQSLAALLVGGCTAILEDEIAYDPQRLLAAVEEQQVTLLQTVPSMMRSLLDACHDEVRLTTLRCLVPTGEALGLRLAQDWLERFPNKPLVNMYGPAECSDDVTWHAIDTRPADGSAIPIGRPTANNRIYILDRLLQPVPVGVKGEICVDGIGVGRGYLNDAAQTARAFPPHPLGKAGRFYRTGDIGRYREDGVIEFHGRLDHQVKIRGFRIELGEIESQLARCEGVVEAVVLVREDLADDPRLVAYVRSEDGVVPQPAAMREHLAQALPDYMVPAAFVVLPNFPLTPNGKLDRKALPAPDESALASRKYEAPQGDAEEAVAVVWQSLLGLGRVGRHDDFFQLGGHSLLAVQLTSRLRERLGVEVPLSEVFAHPVLADFAAQLARAGATAMAAITQADRTRPLPLSWAQQRLWFLDQLDAAAGAAYHMPAGLRLSGALDRTALRATLDRVVARHESLRTTFVLDNGEPVQRIADEGVGFALIEQDLSTLDEAGQRREVDRVSAEFFSQPFDLARGPLIRGRLLALAPNEHVLLINQHHIISDGWSIGVLVREVGALYEAHSQGHEDPLQPLTLQYADYAAWQRQWLQGERLQAQLDYWKANLTGAPELLDLPIDRPRPAVQSYAGASVELHLSAELTQGLKALGQRHGATLFMTLLAGWSVLMARLSGQGDVVVGTPVANRPRREVEGLIGFFLNTLALRLGVEDGPSVAEMLKRTAGTVVDAYAHQDVPFEQVLDAVQPVRSISHSPLFQVMLTLNNTPAEKAQLSTLAIEQMSPPHTASYCDLYLSLHEHEGGIAGGLVYATDLFDETTVQRVVGSLQQLLAGMVADEQASVLRLPIVAAEELSLQWDTWNRSEQSFPLERGYIALFEEQARLHPDRLAATDARERLSYRELDERANRLALALVAHGAGRETLVTLMCERNVMFLAMMLATFKAGAAFLPLDIKDPPARLMEIVRSSGSPLVLASERCAVQVQAVAGELAVKTVVADAHWRSGEPTYVHGGGQPDDLAYVIFTSGSTGKPKGAMVEQRGMLNHLFGKITSLNVGPDELLAQTAAPSFDICVWQSLAALLVGGCTAILEDEIAYDPQRLLAAVDEQRVTLLQTVPSMMRSLLDACHDEVRLTTLRCLVPTGEALGLRLAQDWLTRFPDKPLVNMYGPAECSDDVTWHAIDTRPDDGSAIPIGRPTANNRIYILDRLLQPVPVGVKGEICVDGIGVGRGYLNDAAQTAKAFPPHPLGKAGRFYRTGDIGRYRTDGVIEFHGRLDHQVKIRGFRIELGEIESQLARCEGVVEAVVLVREDQPGEPRLVAYLTGDPPESALLRQRLGQQLPDYMVPTAFVLLPSFPLTPNGKLDRKAFPAPDFTALSGHAYEAPEGEIETTLAEIWQELLRVPQVGRHDHFFELGGSSLMASQVVVRLRKRLGLEVPLMQVFQTPGLADLAENIVLLELRKFDLAEIEALGADLAQLSDEELQAQLEQERMLKSD